MKAKLPPETIITVIRSDRSANLTKPETCRQTVRESLARDPRGRDAWYTAQGRFAVTAYLVEPFAEFPIGTPVFRTFNRDGAPVAACHVTREGK